MKRLSLILCLILVMLFPITASAEEEKDNSTPRLMVTDYQVENGFVSPGSETSLSITIKNTSTSKTVKNIKLTLSDESGEVRCENLGTEYVSSLRYNRKYVWNLKLTAIKSAQVKEHRLTLSMEYEDENGASYSANDVILVQVREAPSIEISVTHLPEAVIQGEKIDVPVTFMNTGNGTIYNCKMDFIIKGLEGGATFIGTIEPGQSGQGTATLRVSKDALGKTEGEIKITYEDFYGEIYTEKIKISTVIEKKAEKTTEPTKNNSTPRLMVTEYNVENGYIKPDSETILSITIKNTSVSKSVSNIKLSLNDESGEIRPDGIGTASVKAIGTGREYVWEIKLTATKSAQPTEHKLNLFMEYEDTDGTSYSASDVLLVQVRQNALLDLSGARLPAKAVQGGTLLVPVTFMNPGKGTLYNCKMDFDVEGLDDGGTTFVGTIESGQSATGNGSLRVSTDILGKVEGEIIFSYEDDYGKVYTEKVKVSTVIEKKVETKETEEEEEKGNKHWYIFILLGLAVGAGLGFGIPKAITSAKQRKEDEKRL